MRQPLQKLDSTFFTQFKTVQLFKKNRLILWPEVRPPGVFYLKKGFIRQYLCSREGKEITVNILKPETYFPIIWALNNSTNIYYYESLTEVTLLRAPRKEVVKQLENHPELLYDLTKRILSGLNGLNKMMEILTTGTAHQQIASVLLVLAKRFGTTLSNKNHVLIELPLTHKIIGTLTGLSRESASLELEKLTKNKIISKKNRFILITNIKKLEQVSLIDTVDNNIVL